MKTYPIIFYFEPATLETSLARTIIKLVEDVIIKTCMAESITILFYLIKN